MTQTQTTKAGEVATATKLPQHTPGPWKNNGGQIEGAYGFPHVIAAVGIINAQGPIDTANARLIAAAPELLAACKALISTGLDDEAIAAAFSAIAKAEAK